MPSSAKSRSRTAKQAIQKDVFDLQGAQQAKRARTKQFRKEAGSYRGATNLAISAIQRTKMSGLEGTTEGRQLQKELKGRTKDLRGGLPFLLAEPQREFKSDIQGINTDLAGAQLDLQQHQQDLQQAIGDAATEQVQNRTEKRTDVNTAYKEALRLVHRQALTNEDPDTGEEEKGHPVPQSPTEWLNFEDALRKIEGVDPRSARKAVKRLKRDWGIVQVRGAVGTAGRMLGG